MSNDLNSEIKIGADASGVEAGVIKAKRSLRELGDSARAAGDNVAAAGDKASKSLSGMGDGGEVAARKIQRDTASMQSSLQRYISTLEAGSKDSRKYWETMASFKGVDTNALRPLLDQLDSYKAKTVVATEATATWTSSLSQIGGAVAGIAAVAATAGLAGKAMFDASASAERLRTMLDFSTGGNSAKEIEYLRGVTYRLGLEFTSTAKAYGQFAAAAKGTALEGDKARAVFESVAKASAVMGLSADDTSGVLLALQQMISKGTVQAEELRGQLGERLPGAFQVAASAMGVTTAELGKMLEQGQVIADDFLPKFAASLEKNLGGAAESAANRLDASLNRLGNAWELLKQTAGDSGVSKAMATEFEAITRDLTAVSDAMENTKKAGGGMFAELASGAGVAAGRMVFSTLNLAANTLNGTINAVTGSVFGLRTDLALLPNIFKTNEQQARALAGELARAEAKFAYLQTRSDVMGGNLYFRDQMFHLGALIKELKAAQEEQRKLAAGTPSKMNDGVTASGRAREQYNTQRAKDVEAANAFRLKQSGVPDGYLKDMAELIRLNQAGVLVGKEYTEALKLQQEELLKKTGVTKAANAGVKQEQTAYEALIASIRSKIAEDQLELKGGAALTESQRMRIKLDEDLATGRLKLNATHEKAVRLALDELATSEAAVKALKTLEKGNLEAAQAREKYLSTLSAGLDKIKADTLAQQEQNERLGLSKLAVADLDAAKIEMLATDVELQAIKAMDRNLDEQTYNALKQQAAAYRELAKLKRDGAVKQELIDSAAAAAEEWKKTAESIERTITDSLMRGFESGKGFAQSLRDTIVNMFKTLVLRPIISFVVNPVAAAITGSLGLSGAANAATTASSGVNMFSGGGSGLLTSGAAGLYSTGAQVYSMGLETLGNSMMSLGNWASANASALQTFGNGLGYASAAISAFKGNWGAAAGSAIGTYFGGPIGATIGNYIGSLIDSAFAGESRSGGQYGVAYDGKVTNNRRGETYSYVGQQYNRDNSTGVSVTNGQSYLMEADGLGATADAAINKAVAGTAETIDKTLAALGSKMQTTGYWAGLETSGKGRGGVFAGGSLTGGVGFGESGKGDNYAGTLYEKWSTQSPDSATAMTNFTLDLKQSVVQALQAAGDIPETIKTMLEDDAGKLLEVETMTTEQVDALLAAIDNQIVAVQTLNTVADMLPLESLKKLSFDASSELIKLAGSLDTLTSQAQSYYETYYSTEEQTANTLKNIKTSLEAVGLELPTTRDGFRSLVEAQDLNTESGRKAYVALMAVSSSFAEVTTAAETAADAAKKEAETKAQAEKDAAESAKTAAISAANAAYSGLERAVTAQKTLLQAQVDAAQETVSTISSIVDTLKSNIDELYDSVATTQIQNQRQALQFIDEALATAQAGGALPDGTALSDAISAARTGMSDTSGYSSLFEQQRAQLILAGKLSQLQDIAGVQKSVAEQQLDAANEQIDQLDQTLAYWKTQTEIATGTYEATLSVADAITALTEALTGATAATTTKPGVVQTGASPEFTVGGGGAGAGTTFNTADSSNAKSLREVYKTSYGWSDSDFKSWYSNPLNSANAEEEARRRGIPVMAVGTNYLPTDGYIYAHQGEAIVPKAYNPAANGVLQSDGQTAKLLTQLIQEVQAMRASTERTASAVEGNQSVPLLVEIAS